MDTSAPSTTPGSREKILDVAEALFARRGFAGVGLREVAEVVGLGKSSLFHHFRSKTELYLAVLGRVLGRLAERLDPVVHGPEDVATRLDLWVDALVDALAEDPPAARLLLRALVEEDDFGAEAPEAAAAVDRIVASLVSGIAGLLSQGVTEGRLRPVSVPDTVQTLVGATVYHFASGEFGESLLGGPLLSAEAVRRRKDELRSLLHRGLHARDRATSEESRGQADS